MSDGIKISDLEANGTLDQAADFLPIVQPAQSPKNRKITVQDLLEPAVAAISPTIAAAIAAMHIGDTAIVGDGFTVPATADSRLVSLFTGLNINMDDPSADDLAMMSNLRLIARAIDSSSQAARITFINDLKAILAITGSGAAIVSYFSRRLDVPRAFPRATVRMSISRTGAGTSLNYTGPSNNAALIAGAFNAMLRFGPYDNDVLVQPAVISHPICTPATPASIDAPARPGDQTSVVESLNTAGIDLDPKIKEYRLAYSSTLSNTPTRVCCNLTMQQNTLIGDYDFSWDIVWSYQNNSAASQTHAVYINVYSVDRNGTTHNDTFLLESSTLAAGATASGRYILRLQRSLDLVYHAMSPAYLP